jgi:hypothetical protein
MPRLTSLRAKSEPLERSRASHTTASAPLPTRLTGT